MGVLDVLDEVADTTAEVASAVGAAGEKVLQVANELVTARSIVIEMDNHLGVPLTRLRDRDNFSSGGFGVLPEDEIPAHNADIFGVQSKGGGIGTGVVGSVTYQGPGFTMLAGFNNPASGNNKANTVLQGPPDTITRFRVSCLIGAGNTAAHARYQLNRHAPYSIRKFVADNNIKLRDPNQQPPSLIPDGLKVALPRSGFDLPPKPIPLPMRNLIVTDGDQAATSSS